MENQDPKRIFITGGSDIRHVELIGRIKEAGAMLLSLQVELVEQISTDLEDKASAARKSIEGMEREGTPYCQYTGPTDECRELNRFNDAEPFRWASIAKTDIQTGLMAMIRAIEQPKGI